jgi:hypothetical protein
MAQAEDPEGSVLATLEAALKNGNFEAMTNEHLGLDQKANEIHHEIIEDQPGDQPEDQPEDQAGDPPDEGGEGKGE